MDLGEVTCNLTRKWPMANFLIIVKMLQLHFNIQKIKKREKGIPGRSRRKYHCEVLPCKKNCTGKEKKMFMWEVKEDRVIRDQIIKGLGC